MEQYKPPTARPAFPSSNRYHVFLSFRGPDVRNTLLDHLYEALSAAGVKVFNDEVLLEKGEMIGPCLEKALESSAIHIPIFSKGYADSPWCLKETAAMLSTSDLIIPLFYHVDPVDVRYPLNESSPYKHAFTKHYGRSDPFPRGQVDGWKDALEQISSRPGWSMDLTQGSEAKLVKMVVNDLIQTLGSVPLEGAVVTYKPSTSKLAFQSDKRYHVFLSFRGPDVRNTLVDHLYEAISAAGLKVFKDEERLGKGEINDLSLGEAIESSAICVPIFSKCYAGSTWCLREAAAMVNSPGLIIPLFYHVDPTHVRYPLKESSPYAQAFHKHYYYSDRYPKEEVDGWKDALHQISSRAGWSMELTQGSEARLVKEVVNDLIRMFDRRPLEVAEHPVGLDTMKNSLFQKLNLNSMDKVIKVGIWGLGGMGKTTVAKAMYNDIYNDFEAASFVFNIRTTAVEASLVTKLQKQILHDLTKYDGKVESIDQGISLLRDRLGGLKVLLILDDLDDVVQLHAFVGDWLAPGSRVIITSKDKHILNVAGVESIHKMSGLETNEALNLFSWNAFGSASPSPRYEDLSKKIVKACKGHPLSLKVIGSFLNDKQNDKDCWTKALHNITDNPNIHKTLYSSYSGLNNVEKEIFVDIACFFIGEHKSFPIVFWKSLYQMVDTAICNLSMKLLIKIDNKGAFEMDDHLRDMGRAIAEKQGIRLWKAVHLNTISNLNISRLRLNGGNPQGLKMLCKHGLRYLHLHTLFIKGTLEDMLAMVPPCLIWLRLEDCTFAIGKNRVIKKTDHSSFVDNLRQLKTMQIIFCNGVEGLSISSLFLIPDIQLQHLEIRGCRNLNNLPDTIDNLSQLRHLDLRGCGSLNNLPYTIGNLAKLQHLDLKRCKNLKGLPDTIGNLSELQHLDLGWCDGLNYIPDSIGNLSHLQHLDLKGCSSLKKLPHTIQDLPQLQHLDLRGRLGRVEELAPSTSTSGGSSMCAIEEYKPPTSKLAFQSDKRYHVFLSFRGPDVRNTLVDHLYEAISAAGLKVFKDEERLGKGEINDLSLGEAIESSAICVPIFSKGYADSAWCLKEAAAMVNSPGLIIPLYYDMDPSNVRYPEKISSPYKQAFVKHYCDSDRYRKEEVDGWKDALHQICSRAGWSMDLTQGREAKLVKMVVNDLIQALGSVPLEGAVVTYNPPTSKLASQSDKGYHVFVSFRGPDVRKTLVGHLYEAISAAGLKVFKDEERLGTGEIIDLSWEKAWGSSAIHIPIFSKGYADSTQCLREAAAMLRTPGLIKPLFYYVDPTQVRYPLNDHSPYKQAFHRHSHSDRYPRGEIEDWKDALEQISTHSGWSLDLTQGSEARLVKMVVNDLLQTLDRVSLEVAKYPVGLEIVKNAFVQKLNLNSVDGVIKFGIWGIRGIGKTTFAKALYNEIHAGFDAASFVFNVCTIARNLIELPKLQKQILSDLSKYDKEVASVVEGISLFTDRLGGKRVLLILDDVDDVVQLNALVGDWLGLGSRVIITSREKDILNVAGVSSECIHHMNELDINNGLQLFSWHAFHEASPSPRYEDMSKRIVEACKGHPLTLEETGSFLYDKQDEEGCWTEALRKLSCSVE